MFHFPKFLPQRGPTTPVLPKQYRFGLFRVRSPLLAESLLFSLPPGTEMFQFPGFAPHTMRCRNRFRRVAPFGNPRIKGYLLLPAAYRSLSRPSSPPRAKASTVCPCLLSYFRSHRCEPGLIYLQLALVTLFYVVHHVKDLVVTLRFLCLGNFLWRITDSNR